jgi:hypothetical protein
MALLFDYRKGVRKMSADSGWDVHESIITININSSLYGDVISKIMLQNL